MKQDDNQTDVTPAQRAVLVTGCSSGLGRAIALHLREHGWEVLAAARAGQDVKVLQEEGFKALQLDLTSSSSIQAAASSAVELGAGRLRAVVNNAGYTQIGAVEDLSREDLRRQFETNVFGAIELTAMLLPYFRRCGEGRFVFISSVCGRFTFPFMGAYCASKYALEAFADALRRELHGSGIYVSLVEPGTFKTRSIETAERIFQKSAAAKSTARKHVYEKVFVNLRQSTAQLDEQRNVVVAETVRLALDSGKPRARTMIPAPSLMYEVAARFFPASLQDALIQFKVRYRDKAV